MDPEWSYFQSHSSLNRFGLHLNGTTGKLNFVRLTLHFKTVRAYFVLDRTGRSKPDYLSI